MRRFGFALLALFVLGMLALPLLACSSPAVTLDTKGGVEGYAGPKNDPGVVGVNVQGPKIGLGSGVVAAPPFASWPTPSQASPPPVEPASTDPSGPPQGKPGADSCSGGACVVKGAQ